jgi:hypothetical protein
MIARFGSVELECLVTWYLKTHRSFLTNSMDFVTRNGETFWWNDNIRRQMFNNAGFFPATDEALDKFSSLMLADVSELDILGSWLDREKYLEKELKGKIKIPLQDIEPYYHPDPWTSALRGKKVLVIHPYEKSIHLQYSKRSQLFTNKNILPEFDLVTIRSVQSISGNKTEFKDWFEALESMKEKVNATEFDIAIIGCGAYGFPLAAHVKRKGKIAVHMGGATQILFGIKGKRWEEMDFFKQLFNPAWTKPLPEETPGDAGNVENGCYW